MDVKLQQALFDRYPEIFSERIQSMTETAMCWGIDTGDGWYDLIDVLCATLQDETRQSGSPQVVATQVKEKHGGLRFYVRAADDRQYTAIEFAEAMSLRICETCGAPGKVDHDGWSMTRCLRHARHGQETIDTAA